MWLSMIVIGPITSCRPSKGFQQVGKARFESLLLVEGPTDSHNLRVHVSQPDRRLSPPLEATRAKCASREAEAPHRWATNRAAPRLEDHSATGRRDSFEHSRAHPRPPAFAIVRFETFRFAEVPGWINPCNETIAL